MGHYAEFNIETGRIIRRGRYQVQHVPKPRRSNAVALIRADYNYNTIVCDKINDEKIAVNPTLARKSHRVKPKPKPTETLKGKRPAHITNEQWQEALKRIEKLEAVQAAK